MSANVILKQILLKRGNSAVSSAYVGPLGEITLDTTFKTIRIHDGITPGGNLIAQGAQGPAGPAGAPGGPPGPQGNIGSTGATGLHVTSANVTVGNLLITLSNSQVINAGLVTGATGPIGLQGNVGSTGATGPAANIAIYDEGNLVIGAVASINFVGAIVTANTSGANVTVTIVGNNVPLTSDRIKSNNAQLIINGMGSQPSVTFPAGPAGQIIISEAEISTLSGNLALTSMKDAYLLANGDGSIAGGARLWRFDRTGSVTLPAGASGDAEINIGFEQGLRINLEDGEEGPSTVEVTQSGGLKLPGQLRALNGKLQVFYDGSAVNFWSNVADPLLIRTGNNFATSKFWTFGTDGGLRTPDNQLTIGGYTIQATGNNEIDLANGPDVTIKSNVGGVAIVSNWAVNPAEWGFLPDGNIEFPNGTRIRDIGNYGSNTTGLELGNHGFRLDFGSPSNDWAIMSGARFIQVQPDETFNITFPEQANWQFANTGNITFPDGTIQSTAWTGSGGGAANTGNVTFADITIQGVGNEYGGGGIYLSPDPTLTANLMYFRVRGGDNPTHLHFDVGDNTVYDQYFGDDSKYLKLEAGSQGNVLVATYGGGIWKFDSTGNLTLPQTAMDVSPAPVSWPGITFSDGTFQNTAYTGGGGGGAASTVDITNTNGLTTTYYPTFVESRTNGQYMRADVDLTYRTDDNLLRAGNIQVGRNIYGSAFYGISTAIQLRPNIDIDKRFLFTVDSSGGNYLRSGMEMPQAEVDKAVSLGFPHLNGNSGYIYIQGTDTNGTEFNDAFNIMMNSGNVKISALSYGNTKIWNFTTAGNIVFPDSTIQSTAWTRSAAQVQSTPPASPVTGQLYYDTDDGRTYIYTGSAWIDANPAGGGGSAALDEAFGNLTAATGVVTHDCTTNRLFYHTSMSANFTANFTNLNLSAGRSTSISLVLVQGGTARMVTAVQIGGVAQTITWQGSASAPAGNANRTDAVTFSILNVGGTYTVLGMMTSFGGV